MVECWSPNLILGGSWPARRTGELHEESSYNNKTRGERFRALGDPRTLIWGHHGLGPTPTCVSFYCFRRCHIDVTPTYVSTCTVSETQLETLFLTISGGTGQASIRRSS